MKQLASTALDNWLRRIGAAQLLESLCDLNPQAAVFAVDGERHILFWNRGAEQLLGFSREEVIGQHCLKANRCHQCMLGCGIAEHGGVSGAKLSLFRQDGQRIQVRKYARGFFDERGDFIGGIEVLRPEPAKSQIAEPMTLNPVPDKVVDFHGMLSRSPAMRQVFQIVRNVAETEATVLVRGESGSGKELIARAVHGLSHRRDQAFLAINCAALTPTLLESELFGHVRGAFSGAIKDHLGLFQRADGGTIFLDEVAELPLELQAKLLRVLQERSFIPVGGERAVEVDIRIVAATHRSLRAEVEAKRFREDLMYRLRVVPIFLPSLRERREDISLLLWRFIAEQNARGPRRIERIAPDAMRALLDYRWPGNIRELKNVVEYGAAVARSPELQLSELPPEFRESAASVMPNAKNAFVSRRMEKTPDPQQEAEKIRQALQQCGGNLQHAAQLLGLSRATLWRKRKKFKI